VLVSKSQISDFKSQKLKSQKLNLQFAMNNLQSHTKNKARIAREIFHPTTRDCFAVGVNYGYTGSSAHLIARPPHQPPRHVLICSLSADNDCRDLDTNGPGG
jgi:hypothetical protein